MRGVDAATPRAGGRVGERLDAAVARVLERAGDRRPRVGVILGSGLGAFAETIEHPVAVPYAEVPHWPAATVAGHAGRLVLGGKGGAWVAALQGRAHLYEGYDALEVAFPVRVLARLGCRALVVTNAAGAVNRTFAPGELMLVEDHLNLQGADPCGGPGVETADAGVPARGISGAAIPRHRFPDLRAAYDPDLRVLTREAAGALGLVLREGVYAGMLGPSYETPAEIRMLERMGADAVGMSTVVEVAAAVDAGMRVAGLSLLANVAAGVLPGRLDHEEVMETAARAGDRVVALLDALVPAIARAVEGPPGKGGA